MTQTSEDPGMLVRVLVIPVFKRHWALHAWSEPVSKQPVDWRAGKTLQDKLKLAGRSINDGVSELPPGPLPAAVDCRFLRR